MTQTSMREERLRNMERERFAVGIEKYDTDLNEGEEGKGRHGRGEDS